MPMLRCCTLLIQERLAAILRPPKNLWSQWEPNQKNVFDLCRLNLVTLEQATIKVIGLQIKTRFLNPRSRGILESIIGRKLLIIFKERRPRNVDTGTKNKSKPQLAGA
jgi:hypothetical protein